MKDPAPRSIAKMLERAGPILARLPAIATLVEVGVSVGILAEHLLRQRRDLKWWGVDPYFGHEEQPAAYKATGDGHAFLSRDLANAHAREAARRLQRFPDRATLLRRASPGAAADFADGSVDLCFLDGRHDYAGVLADCFAWWPKVSPGGWLASHDFSNPDARFLFGVNKAIEDFAAAMDLSFEPDDGCTVWIRKP